MDMSTHFLGELPRVATSRTAGFLGLGEPCGSGSSRPRQRARSLPVSSISTAADGCWVNIESHEGICRAVANAGGVIVVTVDYRLAPEHRFPAAAEDAYAATLWVADHAAELGR